MSTHKHIDAICLIILVFTLLATVLFMNGESYGIQKISDGDYIDENSSLYFTENDLNDAWDISRATLIRLSDDGIDVSGGGAYAFNGDVMITAKGKYVVSGTLSDGSIVVDADSTSKVWILLDGADIRCSENACIRVEQADKVFITLAEGSENHLTTENIAEEMALSGVDAALFSRDDLTINGPGSLDVQALAGHGIAGNDRLVITGGSISVNAVRDALHANDCLYLCNASLSLTAEDEGIDVNGETSFLYLESGRVEIKSADNGISALGSLLIAGGELSIDAGDDGISATDRITISDGAVTIRAYDDGIHSDTSVSISGGTIDIPECYEGMEAVTVEITGGEISIFPEDDGINANGGSGGFGGGPGMGMGGHAGFGMGRDDQGNGRRDFHADAEGSAEAGAENMQGGFPDGRMNSPADGEWPQRPDFPAEGMPSEMPAMPEMSTELHPGQRENAGQPASTASDSVTETWIHISGGSVTIVNEIARDADGLDSNGDILITGGSVRISLVNSGSNSALDYGLESGGTCVITGGEVIACGSYSMAEGFDSSSTQCSVLYNFARGADAGTEVRLEDSNGRVILSYEVPNTFSSVVLSSPELKTGETYTIRIGDYAEEITPTDISSSFGDAQSEGFGGPMNWGRMQRQRDDYWEQSEALLEDQAD